MALRTGLVVTLVVGLAAGGLSGCKRETRSRERQVAEAPASSVPAAPSAEELARAKEREARVRVLLDEWLRAQNAGDFPAYEALYAERFTGIKRVGEREQRFDRAGWVEDRKALFQRASSVSIDDVRVSATEASAVALFTQSWSSANFRDVGQKQLVLTTERGALRIASEEMKNSDVGAAQAATSGPKPEEFAFVVEAPEPLLVLSKRVPTAALTGEPRYVDDQRARHALKVGALGAEWQALVGTTFTLYEDGGAVCEASVAGIEALANVQVHFGLISAWNGEYGEKAAPAARARDLWQQSELGGRFLVGRLEPTSACTGALWARASKLPAPTLWTSRPPNPEEKAAVLSAVRATKLHKDAQAEFTAAFQQTTPWDDSGPSSLRLFEDGRGQTFAALTASTGVDDSCSSPFDIDVFFLLQKRGTSWALVSAPPSGHVGSAWPRFLEPLHAETAFDLEGDGRPEFVGGMDFMRESNGAFRSVLNCSAGYFSCPC